MLSFFALAFFFGMSHALEADHVAAVSAIATGQKRLSSIVRTGLAWGTGHCLMLILIGGTALAIGLGIGDGLAGKLELFVGLMLMGLGGHILFRLIRDRVHFHFHKHDQKSGHIHAHSHAVTLQNQEPAARQDHKSLPHDHDHTPYPVKSLIVGMMHGMAGSAALLVLTASRSPTLLSGLVYVVLFGLGSIAGMVVLSAAIAVPIALSARFLTWAHWGLKALAGTVTLALGISTVVANF